MEQTDAFDLPGPIRQADGSTRFRVWAPRPRIALHLIDPIEREVPMHDAGDGYHEVVVPDLADGGRYYYRLNDTVDRPDPASRSQPQGVHGPSRVTCTDFSWTDAAWRGRPWDEIVIYEAHVGTFSPGGTFEAMIAWLDELVALGVTALQLMPVAQFPGGRNWGYDGVHPYAPQNTYGGPVGLKTLVDACHARGLEVILDVVYNHLGPEGNYLAEFGPYFTDRYRTPWGSAINYDGPDSDAVRDFFIGNALYWLAEFHVDALRLDATHAILDQSPRHFLRELADRVGELAGSTGRRMYLIAESNANDPRIVRAAQRRGYGVDAQLVDDFHRALHALLTGERQGWYSDFGSLDDFAAAFRHGFVLTGRYSRYRRRHWGADPGDIRPEQFVAFTQCHDTVGNRPASERLGRLVDFEQLKLAAAATILSPCTPLLFMGEEYDDPAPFHYFTSHLDARLGEAVRAGRLREFAAFNWPSQPPDPQSEETFARSRLTRGLADQGPHAILRRFYQELLRLRRDLTAIRGAGREGTRMDIVSPSTIMTIRRAGDCEVCMAYHFGQQPVTVSLPPSAPNVWTLLLNSASQPWGGPLPASGTDATTNGSLEIAPTSCLVLTRGGAR